MSDNPIVCATCGETVELQRSNQKLKVRCACERRSIKVASKLPEGWQ